jgi:putative tricarboxylic transport membrane protein
MKLMRSRGNLFYLLSVASILLVVVPGAFGDNYPEKPVTIIVSTSPGGGLDTAIRQLLPFFEKALGGKFILQYQAGGSTAVANTIVAKSKPDGYMIDAVGEPHYQLTFITQKVSYTIDDLFPLGPFSCDPGIYRVRKDAPWKDLKELIEYAKTKPPRTIKVSVSERTSGNYLAVKQLEEATGVTFNIVPFGGGNPARLALLGGQVDLTNAGVFNSLPIADKSRVIAVQYQENKWPGLTDNAKTVNQQLGTNLSSSISYNAFWVPAKIRTQFPDRYKKLAKAFNDTLTDKEYLAQMKKLGIEAQVVRDDPDSHDKESRELLKELQKYKDLLLGP